MTSKGQLTIPKELRERLGLEAGQAVEVTGDGRKIEIRKKIEKTVPLSELGKGFPRPSAAGKPLSCEEMDKVIGEAVQNKVGL